MTSTTFFFIFIPILGIILLLVNFILAPHNPYQEKDSVLVNKLIPFFVLKFINKNIILNIEFILLYSSLLLFTYSIFQSTYYGDIRLFSVCLILALFLFIYIYINYINLTLIRKYPLTIHATNILVLIVIVICLFLLINSMLLDFNRLLMDISRMLNPKTPSPEPPYKGGGNSKGGPNNNGPNNNNPSGLSSSSKAPNSSEDKRSNTPDSPEDEFTTKYNSLSDRDIVVYLQREKQRVVDERISNNSSYTSLTLSDLGIKLTGDWRDDPYRVYLNRNIYYKDPTRSA